VPSDRAPGAGLALRPHHLLCLLTYAGRGYSPGFVANFDRIAARIAAGQGVTLVDGPDSVCAPCLDDPAAHCRNDSVRQRDAAAGAALAPLLGPLHPGRTLVLDAATLGRLRAAFARGDIRSACQGCEWRDLCSAIADQGFAAARIPPV